jgi:site-specific DNA-methyltransferase (adenine-specific)
MKISKIGSREHKMWCDITGSSSTVIRGECMRYMKSLPDNSFDLAICDPPYYDGPQNRLHYGAKVSNTDVKRTDYKQIPSWRIPKLAYYNELIRVSKKVIIWGANYYGFCNKMPGRIVWDKVNSKSSFSDCELAMTNCHKSVRMFSYMWNGMCQGVSFADGKTHQGDKRLNETRIHQTQKPVELYKWLLNEYSRPDFKVLDTHIGSQSIREAIHEMPFTLHLVGTEIDHNKFNSGNARLEKYARNLKIPFTS